MVCTNVQGQVLPYSGRVGHNWRKVGELRRKVGERPKEAEKPLKKVGERHKKAGGYWTEVDTLLVTPHRRIHLQS